MALTTHRTRPTTDTVESPVADALDVLLIEEFVLWTSACHFLRIAGRDTSTSTRELVEAQCCAATDLVDDVVRRLLDVGGRPHETLEWLQDGISVVTPAARGTRDALRTLTALHETLDRTARDIAENPAVARLPALAGFCEHLAGRHRREAGILRAKDPCHVSQRSAASRTLPA